MFTTKLSTTSATHNHTQTMNLCTHVLCDLCVMRNLLEYRFSVFDFKDFVVYIKCNVKLKSVLYSKVHYEARIIKSVYNL